MWQWREEEIYEVSLRLKSGFMIQTLSWVVTPHKLCERIHHDCLQLFMTKQDSAQLKIVQKLAKKKSCVAQLKPIIIQSKVFYWRRCKDNAPDNMHRYLQLLVQWQKNAGIVLQQICNITVRNSSLIQFFVL